MQRLVNLQVLVGRWKGAFNCSINKLNPERERSRGRVRGEKPDEINSEGVLLCYKMKQADENS